MFDSIHVTDDRAAVVIAEIEEGSDPHWRFFALLMIASMIACFGLVANSSAVIIGAMLVSPLMTPIFGVALGLLRGSPKLASKAATAELLGIVLAIGSAYIVGVVHVLGAEATPEMLARTSPNLIDLLVAVFAGLAGAFALVDERISPALPGVAIATAIVPPLSTCGLCLAFGAWAGAGGALLLFVANLVSILFVALVVFAFTGLTVSTAGRSWRTLLRQFGPTFVSFVVVAVVLTNSLMRIAVERTTELGIRETLLSELDNDPAIILGEFRHVRLAGRVQVLATVRSPRIVKPKRVAELEQALREQLDAPVDLVVRTSLSKDVTREGARFVVRRANLDGRFLDDAVEEVESRATLAEQVIREQFQSDPGFELTQVDFGSAESGNGIVIAYINSLRRLAHAEIARTEDALRKRLSDPQLDFFVRVDSAKLENRNGTVLVEWVDFSQASQEELDRLPEYEQVIKRVISETTALLPLQVHFKLLSDRTSALAEVVGPTPVTIEDVRQCEKRIRGELGDRFDLHLLYRSEYVVGTSGYTTYDDLTDASLEKRITRIREIFGKDAESQGKKSQRDDEGVESQR